MEGYFMKETIRKTIELLKEKVKGNLLEIQNNQKDIRSLLKEPVTSERSAQLEAKYASNKTLLAENNDFINVQLTLTNFLDKYNSSDIFEKTLVVAPILSTNEKECFELTINGQIPFNSEHPFYNNDSFFNKLLVHYQNIEDYESCSKLVRVKNQQ
jgi:hypothetical protein